ncbi:hypothetical protein D3C73_1064000 [compost metagenome]
MISDAEGLTNPRSGISKSSASFVAGLTSFVTPFPARVLAIAFVESLLIFVPYTMVVGTRLPFSSSASEWT